jgi:hypothetical protein
MPRRIMSIIPIDSIVSIEADVLAAIRRLRYGAVEVTVHDGRIVQIETREKVRVVSADRRPPDSRRRDHDASGGADRSAGGPGRDAETSE